ERSMTGVGNSIERSEGAEILFRVDELDIDIPVFTTRPDTLFGATFFVVAPEHSFVQQHASDEAKEYAKHAGAKRTEERAAEAEKTGVFTGHYATNPVNGERLPIWVADYVLMDYGTGAIMAVPAHDERDREFAETFDLPILPVIDDDGKLINSMQFDGTPADEAKRAIVAWLHTQGRGAAAVSYRLRDWSFSRQRYWGCPIPIVYCDDCGCVPVPDEELPVLLPDIEDYQPKGKPPLASNEEWINVTCPKCGGRARRDADTMDTFVDSSWYFIRYVDPHNDRAPFDKHVVDYWLPVDFYIGGIDHLNGHLLYSRFFVKALNDMGMLSFLRRLWRVVHDVADRAPADGPGTTSLARTAHRTIAKVSDDVLRRTQFHTPISAVMELVNELSDDPAAPDARFAAETAVSLIQPYAPHIGEELWTVLGHERLWEHPWPVADPSALEQDTFELVVQVNGKVRDRFEVSTDLSEDELVQRALASERVQAHLDGRKVVKTIVVPHRLVNIVIG